jgi:type I restriction enzyme S subunit
MASIVAAWPTVALGEVAGLVERPEAPIAGKLYRQAGVRLWGQGVYERESVDGGMTQYKTLSRVEADDIIVNKIWARNGSVSIVTPELSGAYVSGEFPTFTVARDRLLPQWFFWLTKTRPFWEQCDELSRGTSGKNRIRPEKFLRVQLPLPPLDEQRRIVARIEALAGRIAEARGLRAAALAEAGQLLPSAVYAALGSIEAYAETVTVESVACSVTDGDHQPPPKSEHGVPFLFISNVVQGHLDMTGCKWVSREYFEALSPLRTPMIGDVLYTAVGSYGVPCLVDTDEPFCFQRHIAIIKPDRNLVMPEYLTWALTSPSVFEQATKHATGSAQLTVPLAAIRRLQFPLPERSEQLRIVTWLDSIRLLAHSLRWEQAQAKSELDALLPSLLDKAFGGEL